MTHEQKINYMRIAASLCNFGFTNQQLDLLTSLYDLVLEKEGKADINSITDVESEVKHRADVKSRSELLDKISEKV